MNPCLFRLIEIEILFWVQMTINPKANATCYPNKLHLGWVLKLSIFNKKKKTWESLNCYLITR